MTKKYHYKTYINKNQGDHQPKAKLTINPLAKSDSVKVDRTRSSRISDKYGWVIVLIFAVSTFATLYFVSRELSPKTESGMAEEIAGYNDWKKKYNLDLSVNDQFWDYSGDGLTNLAKFRLSLDPKAASDSSVILAQNTPADRAESDPQASVNIADPTNPSQTNPNPSNLSIDSGSNAANQASNQSNTNTNNNGGSNTSETPAQNQSGSAGQNTQSENPAPNANTAETRPQSSATGVGGSIPLPTNQLAAGNVSSNNNTETGGGESQTEPVANNSSNNTTATPKITRVTSTTRSGGGIDNALILTFAISMLSGGYTLYRRFEKNTLAVHEGEF